MPTARAVVVHVVPHSAGGTDTSTRFPIGTSPNASRYGENSWTIRFVSGREAISQIDVKSRSPPLFGSPCCDRRSVMPWLFTAVTV